MRPSMALRCPANSDNSPNNTSTRSPARTTGTSSDAVDDITPSSQRGTTNSGHPSPGQAIRCQQAQPDRRERIGGADHNSTSEPGPPTKYSNPPPTTANKSTTQ